MSPERPALNPTERSESSCRPPADSRYPAPINQFLKGYGFQLTDQYQPSFVYRSGQFTAYWHPDQPLVRFKSIDDISNGEIKFVCCRMTPDIGWHPQDNSYYPEYAPYVDFTAFFAGEL